MVRHKTVCKECEKPAKDAWSARNRAVANASVQRWRLKYPEKNRAMNDSWVARNPEKVGEYRRSHQRIRRARKKGNGHLRYDSFAVFEREAWLCCLCGLPMRRIERGDRRNHKGKHPPDWPTIEHVRTIKAHGPDDPANVRASHARCNQRRHTMDFEEAQRKFGANPPFSPGEVEALREGKPLNPTAEK